MNKKIIISIIALIMIVGVTVVSVKLLSDNKTNGGNDKIKIMTTLFPQYDFVRQIGQDKVDVSLLLPFGVESHSYEPTPTDIININNAAAFIYTGKDMEPWAETIISSVDSDTKVVDVSKNVSLINSEQFEKDHESQTDEGEAETTEKHEHENDPHIWLNPKVAEQMVDNIVESLIQIDPDNTEYYEKNAKEYKEKLSNLDSQIEETVKISKRNKIAFGGAFSYAYFVERYGLDFVSAYDSCGEESEPSVNKVKSVIDDINNEKLPVVFYQDLTEGNIAKTIAQETNATALPFYSIHNVSKTDVDNGVTYLSLMEQNLKNLKIALN